MARLLVFLHLVIKQRALQAELQAALASLTVTAVGRVADVDRALQEGQDAMLTLLPVLNARGLKPKLTGYRNGRSDETYALVAVEAPPDPARVAVVGALDLLGREGTTSMVHELTTGQPKVERVSKLEDLLPLLQLQRVEAILLPSRLVSELQNISRMKLVPVALAKRVGLPAVTLFTPAGQQALNAVAKLKAEISRDLGVEEWR